jgi:sugar phosphate isomerase/epimerase
MTRRELAKVLCVPVTHSLLQSGLLASPKAKSSVINGVQVGIQSYSFGDRSFESMVTSIAGVGINSCELWSGHLEPRNLDAEGLTRWRLENPISQFEFVGRKFRDAGIELNAFYYDFRKNMSDVEIERGFLIARSLGITVITSSSNPSISRRVDRFAREYRIRVGMHNHPQEGRPDEFGGPNDFAQAMRESSEFICVSLDIGHFVAAGYDPVKYLAENPSRIVTLHLKDRKKGLGRKSPTVRFGTGDTPIKEVLQLLKRKQFKIPANIEHEIKEQDPVQGVKESLEYCRQALT